MALFKRLESFGQAPKSEKPKDRETELPEKPEAPPADHAPRTTHHVPWKVRLRRIGIAAAGVLVTAIAGYLLAALVLFPAPFRSGARQVPHVMGMDENDARRQAERQGMTLDVSAREPHPTAPMGTVVWQEPPPGVAVARGFRIAVTMSTGMPRVAIPDVRGFDPAFAQRLLMAAGLGVDGVDSVDVVSMPSGLVAGTSPRGGDSVALGQRIMLQVTR